MDNYLDLMTQRSLVLGDPLEAAKRVDEVAAETLDVARVSVWMVDPEVTKITCTDLFERAGSDGRLRLAGHGAPGRRRAPLSPDQVVASRHPDGFRSKHCPRPASLS